MGHGNLEGRTMEQTTVRDHVERIKRNGKKLHLVSGERWDWHHDAERYLVDFAIDYKMEGWKQFDTSQDAWYFGVWVNPGKLSTLTYAEGDWTLTEYTTKGTYNINIKEMCEFYDDGFIAKAIDRSGEMTVYRQDRQEFFI